MMYDPFASNGSGWSRPSAAGCRAHPQPVAGPSRRATRTAATTAAPAVDRYKLFLSSPKTPRAT